MIYQDLLCAWDRRWRSFRFGRNSVRCAHTTRDTCVCNPHCSSPSLRRSSRILNTSEKKPKIQVKGVKTALYIPLSSYIFTVLAALSSASCRPRMKGPTKVTESAQITQSSCSQISLGTLPVRASESLKQK